MKKTILFILSCTFMLCANAQKISREDVIKDIDAMACLLEEIHPNMFAECPASLFYEELEKAKLQIADSVNLLEAYKIIEPLTALLQDGHTQLAFPREQFTGNEFVFPLSTIVNTNDSTIITDLAYTAEGTTIPVDAHILSINGMPYKSIIEEMLKYHSGERTFFRLTKTSMNFSDLLFILHPFDTFNITYNYDNTVHKATLKAIPRKDVKNAFLTYLFTPPRYSYRIEKEKDVAILTMKSLANRKDFQALTEKMFSEIKELNIGNLIVDLRNNGGGDSKLGDNLISYLVDEPFNQFHKVELKISEPVKAMGMFPDSTGVLILDTSNYITQSEPKPLEERYTGHVYVLTNHMTFSSASSLVSLLKHTGVAQTIGEETGGMSISYGNIVQQTLPHTGLTMIISFARMHLTGSTEEDIHGVLPDFPTKSADALNKAMSMIEGEEE